MSKQLELKIEDYEGAEIMINRDTADDLSLEEDDLCKITFPITMNTTLVNVIIDDEVENYQFIGNEEISYNLGIEEGFECRLEKFGDDLKELDELRLKLENLGEEEVDVNKYITNKKEDVIEKLDERYLNTNSTIPVEEFGIYIEVESTKPKLSSEEFAVPKDSTTIELSKKYKSYFNGILVIDSSKSMSSTDEKDMMKPLKNDVFLKDLSTDPDIKEYIREKIEKETRITKLDAAILAVLAFLSAKVSRGRGEDISIILWSEEAIPLNFVVGNKKKSWISAGEIGDRDTLAEVIASELLSEADRISSRGTNMENSILKAKEIRNDIVEKENNDYPTMIIFLTDGKRTAGRSPVSVVKEEISSLDKTVIHTIGLGDDVDEQELSAMARAGGGKYFNTRDVKELIQFYDKEASEFSSVDTKKDEDEMSSVLDRLNDMKG